jgi:hypothetical protein
MDGVFDAGGQAAEDSASKIILRSAPVMTEIFESPSYSL